MKEKTQKQGAYLLSKVSPLEPKQQKKLKKELHSGAVRIKKGKGYCAKCGGDSR